MVSVAATLDKSVSSTPDLRLSNSMLDRVLLSTSIVLFVNVWLPTKVATVESMANVTPLPDAVESSPVPPNKESVSLSRSIAMSLEPSETSKSCAVMFAST